MKWGPGLTTNDRRKDPIYWARIEDAATAVDQDPREWGTIDALAGLFMDRVRTDIAVVLEERRAK